jgi:hypothetical protein
MRPVSYLNFLRMICRYDQIVVLERARERMRPVSYRQIRFLTVKSGFFLEFPFGQDVWIPTESGFTNEPGCTESFSAEAKIVLKEGGRMVGRWRVPMCALEFGGAFQKS